MAVRLVGYKQLRSMQCVMSTIDEIKILIIIEYSYYSQNVKQNSQIGNACHKRHSVE